VELPRGVTPPVATPETTIQSCYLVDISLTLFSLGGWGTFVLNLNVYDFFNIQAKATKLCDFSYKIYLETIWYKLSLVIKSNDAMAPTSDIQISANFEFCFANFTFKII